MNFIGSVLTVGLLARRWPQVMKTKSTVQYQFNLTPRQSMGSKNIFPTWILGKIYEIHGSQVIFNMYQIKRKKSRLANRILGIQLQLSLPEYWEHAIQYKFHEKVHRARQVKRDQHWIWSSVTICEWCRPSFRLWNTVKRSNNINNSLPSACIF